MMRQQTFCIMHTIIILLCLQISLIYTVHSNVTIMSLTDCELFVIKRDALRKVLYFHPEGNVLVCACMHDLMLNCMQFLKQVLA